MFHVLQEVFEPWEEAPEERPTARSHVFKRGDLLTNSRLSPSDSSDFQTTFSFHFFFLHDCEILHLFSMCSIFSRICRNLEWVAEAEVISELTSWPCFFRCLWRCQNLSETTQKNNYLQLVPREQQNRGASPILGGKNHLFIINISLLHRNTSTSGSIVCPI